MTMVMLTGKALERFLYGRRLVPWSRNSEIAPLIWQRIRTSRKKSAAELGLLESSRGSSSNLVIVRVKVGVMRKIPGVH